MNVCDGCPHLRVTHDISGYEAKCTAKSFKGRMIAWQYGLNMRWCRTELWSQLKKKAPFWCPKMKEEKKNGQANGRERPDSQHDQR